MPRMMVYAWIDLDGNKDEVKFGDHFVPIDSTLSEAIEHTKRYIRLAQFPRRGKHFDSGRVLVQYWDVSEYAKKYKKFHKASKIDDVIRPAIGHYGTVGTEFHICPFDELIILVNKELARSGQKLIPAKLSTQQAITATEVCTQFNDGNKRILASLCARFGKTIWAGAVAKEQDFQVIVVASYVKTVFASFAKDLIKFEQFADYEHIDCLDQNYQESIDEAIANGKPVIAYLSLANGTKREERIDYLASWDTERLWIVDEADFGAHTPKQFKALNAGVQDDDYLLLMTGTNPDKAVSEWELDHTLTVTYPELVIQKKISKKLKRSPKNDLLHFKTDIGRDALVADIACYRAEIKSVADAVADTLEEGEFKLLPCWTKFAAHPLKAKAFFVRMLESIYKGTGGHNHLNMDLQFMESGLKVDMMFLPGSIRNDNLMTVVQIAEQVLPNFKVIAMCGDGRYNDKKLDNHKAEVIVKEAVREAQEHGQNVLIISAGMAARSFSIPELSTVYLAYDEGDLGATMQKMSRALTPHNIGKVGKVVDLAFDPNRSDKFDQMIIETASNFKKRHDVKSLAESMQDVLTTIDIFDCTNNGPLAINKDDFLKGALARKSVSRVIGNMINMSGMDNSMIAELASGNTAYSSLEKQGAASKGKTRDAKAKQASKASKKVTKSLIKKAREAMVVIYENLDIIILGTNSKSLAEAMNKAETDVDIQTAIVDQFNVTFNLIDELFAQGYLNEDYAELVYDFS